MIKTTRKYPSFALCVYKNTFSNTDLKINMEYNFIVNYFLLRIKFVQHKQKDM